MLFTEEKARIYDRRLNNPGNCYLEDREKTIILNLLKPQRRERVLEIGCGDGGHLHFFHEWGCAVSGLESSPLLLELARQKLDKRADLYLGRAEDLPFSDNEFDIVSLMLSVTFTGDVEQAVSEAIRVCRGRVFLGGVNPYSLAGLQLKMECQLTRERRFHFFRAGELRRIVRRFLPGVRIEWGSVIFLPASWYGHAVALEEVLPVRRNPFGAFWGFSFPVIYTVQTVQDLIGNSFRMKQGEHPVQGISRGR